jgi:nitronate monooxygenase
MRIRPRHDCNGSVIRHPAENRPAAFHCGAAPTARQRECRTMTTSRLPRSRIVMSDHFRQGLKLPLIAAPMFLVSGPELVIAACRAGIIGSFPASNAKSSEEFRAWLNAISEAVSAGDCATYAVNLVVRNATDARFRENLAIIEEFRVPIVITSVGQPGDVSGRVHAYGGIVFHDVATMRHAEKAIAAGVDGLILLTAGAGGHTGTANPFAFVRQVRAMWDGLIILAGCLGDGYGVRAAEVLGADLAYMGTRFAATRESRASDAYKALLVSQKMSDIVVTDRISGLPATFMRGSIAAAGLDPDDLPATNGRFDSGLPPHIKAWRDVWSAGHGVGSITDIPSVADLARQLVADYRAAGGSPLPAMAPSRSVPVG